jgi:succinoglycan biosynthesis protein ExoA
MNAQAGAPRDRITRVSVIAPMYNEARHIHQFIDDLAAQDYGGDIEIFVADGESTDGSVTILEQAASRAGLRLFVIGNPERLVSHGLNRCIRRATGQLIVRLDCHSSFPSDYLRRCVEAAEDTGAWNVGGRVVPSGHTPMEKAVACAMDSPFGGIGWTRHAIANGRVEVDTVTFGAFRPDAFAAVGLFDESLVRDQDDEMNLRIRRANGRVVLDPTITCNYTPRGTWRGVFRQYYEYGLWKVPVMRKHGAVLGARSLAPVAFVGSIALLALASLPMRVARYVLVIELGTYASAAATFAGLSVRRRGESLRLLPRAAVTFPAFHLGYGIGMAHGALRLLDSRRRTGEGAHTFSDEGHL